MGTIKKFRILRFKKLDTVIEFENVSFSYGNRLILDNINFKVNKNQILGLLGSNGAGKSTIFNLIIGLVQPKTGKIKFLGEDITNYPAYIRAKKFHTSFVPQYGGVFADLTLYENLLAISEIVIENKNYRIERVNYLLSKFEFDNIRDVKAKFLSGGQKKRCAIALALLKKPKVLLLDEIYASLDVRSIRMMQEIIVDLQNEENITTLITDHQARDLLATCDAGMILDNGKIVAHDTPSNLVNNISAKKAYFGESFKFN
jgi:lipopolysaccharide export system ATP-binding protein